MRQQTGFTLRSVCGRSFLVATGVKHIAFGRMFELSESAAWLWQEAARQGEFTAESLAGALCEEYELASEEALRDTRELLAQWRDEGLICEDREEKA
ncbi:MAG: PqqD family protein [Bacteroidaceae bacterium]|nr:PqqD family protein [Bacteroidaceae bacterium]